MTAQQATAWYVYAVVPSGAAPPDCDCAILPGAALALIEGPAGVDGPGLCAVASLVPRALFAPNDPTSRAAEPEWVAARAAAHHDVVAQLAASGPCLPLGFGTLFASTGGVAAWMGEQGRKFHAILAQVADRQEWAVNLLEDAAEHAAWLRAHDGTVLGLAAAAGAAGPGTAYLLARRLDKAVAAARAAHAQTLATSVAACLAGLYPVLTETPPDGAAAAWCVLAPQGDALGAPLAACAQMLAGTGLALRVTGPWPPYAFARAGWQGGVHG